MADTVTEVVTIVQFPRFQAFVDAVPMIGAKLYSYAPFTSTPKATYSDPGYVNPNPNPTVMDDQGGAYVHLQGTYHLRLHDADDVLVWEVDQYEFPSVIVADESGMLTGSTETTVSPIAGTGVISIPGMAPAGYRVLGVTSTITTTFGTSNGLTQIQLGDQYLQDRWGSPASLAAGEKTNQLQFHAGDQPVITPTPYVLLIAAIGGLYDTSGAIHVTAHWQSLPVDVVP